jgi:dTDP-glucose pyrophosphorylase
MRINLIPMGGIGSRFSIEGYLLPKALIPVSGVPMIIKAIRDMPTADKWIFIVKQEHIDKYKIDEIIKSEIPESNIIGIEKTTEGQACTCLLAEKYFKPDDSLFIAACDVGYLYDEERYNKLINNSDIDGIFWTFTQRQNLKQNPTAWGWCYVDSDKITVKDISVKVPITDDPYRDHAIVSAFFFKRSKDFVDATKLMIKNNCRINNEFYIDSLPRFMKRLGKRTVIFDVELFLCWGDPKSLYEYQYWEYFCKYHIKPKNMVPENEKIFPLWKQYFEKDER